MGIKIHFHKWEELWDVYFGPLSYDVKRIYRHCVKCNKWQKKYVGLMGEVYWVDSNLPKTDSSLTMKNYACAKIKEIEKEKESY